MQKKGQEGVIITVLLVLIAIGAVAAVSYFIINQVRQGQAQATDKLSCGQLNYEIVGAVKDTNSVTIRRIAGGDSITVDHIIVSMGTKGTNSTTNPGMMELVTIPVVGGNTLASGDKIDVAPVLKGGITCDIRSSFTVL